MSVYSIVIITITVIHVVLSAEFAADNAGLLFLSTIHSSTYTLINNTETKIQQNRHETSI